MTRIIARPADLDLDSPGRRDYWVALEHDTMWGEHHIPLTVMVGPGATPDQGLLAIGSNHGNEYEGPVAIKHLIGEIDIAQVVGRLIFIPVLNPAAFHSGTRESTDHDGVNLNRAFVDGAGVTPALAGITHRIAAFVRQYLWPRVHIVQDIHSGGDALRFALCSSFHEVDDPAQSHTIEETARWYGTPFVITYQNETPGLLPSEAERLGKITVGTELGWGETVNLDGVRYAKQGLRAAAIRHGLMQGQIEPMGHHADGTQKLVAMVERECFVPAPYPGHYEPLLECGTQVSRGDTVGWLHDFYRIDDAPWPVTAGVDGYVLSQASRAPVIQGMHILVVAQEVG
ncbi:MAG: succinylglutamate desuccinylase [Gemmatimonadetes bacterium]|nr:succinylglutamate desuccinylase [Gemmatimonadota bacterium]MBT6149212.1 succinylglutamate desuccinylase [Gemmatimonadota bacterium]MBT7863043.1 succinylglutamate desuccinylase [Gemmatimonadota bacterium]